MKRISYFILFIFILSSCNKVLFVYYGIQNPAIENHQSLCKYLAAKNIEIDDFFVWDNMHSLQKLQEFNLGIPDGIFFNKDGYSLPYSNDSINCNAGVGYFIEYLASPTKLKVDSSRHIEELTSCLINSKSQKSFNEISNSHDTEFYIFIFWARYTGRLNKVKVQKWIEQYKEMSTKNDHVKIFFINCDFQESWDVDTKTMKELKITK